MFCKSKVAPDAIVVPAAFVPKALFEVIASVPDNTVVEPVKVLFPLKLIKPAEIPA